MKLSGENLKTQIKNLLGDKIKMDNTELTLGTAIAYALKTSLEEERNMEILKVVEQYMIAKKIVDCGPGEVIELSSDEVVIIENKVSKVWRLYQPQIGVEVAANVYLALEGKHPEIKQPLNSAVMFEGTVQNELNKQ